LLQNRADSLLSPQLHERRVHLMVTQLWAQIYCAHDETQTWQAMAELLRRAAKAAKRDIRIFMDLGGPMICTSSIAPGPAVLKRKPEGNAQGHTTGLSRLSFEAVAGASTCSTAQPRIVGKAKWLIGLRMEMQIDLTGGDLRTFLNSCWLPWQHFRRG
jgi:hypothetical protein